MAKTLDVILTEINQEYDLYAYATHAAAVFLVESWTQGIEDGTPLASMVSDVDEVILRLNKFKADALAIVTPKTED